MKRIRWTDESAIKAIKYCMGLLNLNVLPTFREMNRFYGNTKLTNYISKHGGMRRFSGLMETPIKESETTVNWKYVAFMAKQYRDRGNHVQVRGKGDHFNLLLEKNIKISIKVSRPYQVNGRLYHSIRLGKRHATCDIYNFILLDPFKHIQKILIIPAHKIKVTQLTISEGRKINNYDRNWELINDYKKFYDVLEKKGAQLGV